MTVSHRAKRVTLRMGTEADRDTLYRLRHAIYGQELWQHAPNEEQRLRDSLDAFNTYFVACIGPEIVGFISVTPGGLDSKTLLARCREHDLFLRNPGTTSPRLGARTARIAVKDARTNARMLEILHKALVA